MCLSSGESGCDPATQKPVFTLFYARFVPPLHCVASLTSPTYRCTKRKTHLIVHDDNKCVLTIQKNTMKDSKVSSRRTSRNSLVGSLGASFQRHPPPVLLHPLAIHFQEFYHRGLLLLPPHFSAAVWRRTIVLPQSWLGSKTARTVG